ncbi:MAG: hypothetical protein Unbinned92contig1002_46 [Prokaryotic dsDNA virus sp.]|nr:MAG: hypothetical protein Unbinned92contig1002_46 [Prokaryotic dsDNA virus sp.]|tara:strand:- start:11440 stop:12018 length:579 start_codon:yes stop_codon:yes gene_type:complete
MDANVTLNKVRTILGLEVILEEKLLENGTKFVAEKFEGGNEVFIHAEDETKIPVPAGEYMMEDGQTLVVKEDGLIDEIRDAEEKEEEDEEMGYEEDLAYGKKKDEEEDEEMNETLYPTLEEFDKLKKMVEDLAKKMDGGDKEEMSDVKEEVGLSAEPKEIKHNPEATKEVELTKIGKVSDLRQRVFNKIFNK